MKESRKSSSGGAAGETPSGRLRAREMQVGKPALQGAPCPAIQDRLARNRWVLAAWALLAVAAFLLAMPTVRDTGLDYDEALYGHLTRDFIQGRHCLQHMPGSSSVELWGRPFPLFVQGYLGAVKCWMLLPSFAVGGATISVMRFTMLAWGILGLGFLMLWIRRVAGQAEAVVAGALALFDPAFFFPTICDWGAFVPSFFLRCAGFYFVSLWWRPCGKFEIRSPEPPACTRAPAVGEATGRTLWLVLAGACFGLGFLNKIDFIVILLALGAASVLSAPRAVVESVRRAGHQWLAGVAAFLVAASPMIVNCVRLLRSILGVQSGPRTGEFSTKLHIAGAVLDGSYFHRLMEAGGMFHKMFDAPRRISTPLGWVLLLAILVLVFKAVKERKATLPRRALFLLGVFGFSVLGVFLLPEAIRIHHFLLVYPFPQLIIAAAALYAWNLPASATARATVRGVVILALVAVLAGNAIAIRKTQKFVSATGGRGTWSKALERFAGENRGRDDIVIASLDWGFHEQLSFLTDKPELYELTWNIQQGKPVSLLQETNFLYMIHPPEFSLFEYGQTYLQAASGADPRLAVESRTNLEGRVVFQYFRFTAR